MQQLVECRETGSGVVRLEDRRELRKIDGAGPDPEARSRSRTTSGRPLRHAERGLERRLLHLTQEGANAQARTRATWGSQVRERLRRRIGEELRAVVRRPADDGCALALGGAYQAEPRRPRRSGPRPELSRPAVEQARVRPNLLADLALLSCAPFTYTLASASSGSFPSASV